MKKTILVLVSLFFTAGIFAQNDGKVSGIVKYTVTTRLEINIEGDASQFSDMLPTEMKSAKELLFNENASLYRTGEKEADVKEVMEGEQTVQIMMQEPQNILYSDLKAKKLVEQREFLSRMFLIEGDIKEREWKITTEQKTILGYPCQKAVNLKDEKIVSAWFTPAIPVPAGPESFSGLPGLVLEVNVDDGEQVYLAESVELIPVSVSDLKKPGKGKKLSKEEFDQIVAEKMEEMGGEGGDGHGKVMMIRIEQ